MTIEEINHEISLLEPAEVNFRNVQVLSSLYVIRDHFGVIPVGSSMPKLEGSEFVRACSGVQIDKLMSILDEHMDSIKVLYPKEYSKLIKMIIS